VHFYQFNISDYRKRTLHLSLTEHAIYRALIDTYYLEESPLCADEAQLMRSHCVRTKDEKEAFRQVLSDFFILGENGYHHEKCDQELAKIYEKSEKARASAKARWKKDDAKCMRTHSERNANGMLPNNLLPITQEKDVIQWAEIQNKFNEILGDELGKIRGFSDARKKHVKARINEEPEKRSSVEWWSKYFEYVSQSDFLTGRGSPHHETGRPFTASFDWIINPNNMLKVLEGKYNGQ